VLVASASGAPGENASEAEYLAYVEEEAGVIIPGAVLFMLGCLAFLWFAVVLRERLGAAEGGTRMLSNVAFVGAALAGAFMMLTPGPEMAAAITAEEQEVSASAAAAMRMLPEAFLVAAALSAILLMLGGGVVALRTRLFPKAWAWFSFLLAALLVIPPIGWAALLAGLPVWVVATTVFLLRSGASPAPATGER
jgi:glucan phosphoethanolaminetransferase (alkaline phosphatase superfamily)